MMRSIAIILLIITPLLCVAQEAEVQLPYSEVPEYAEAYTVGTVAARMVDGLGFRYYWATEGLRNEDLSYKPSKDGRTTAETIDHLYGLSKVIVNTTLKKPTIRGEEEKPLDFLEKRKQTLLNFKKAADILRVSDDLSEFNMVFQSADGNISSFPFWNNINGPIADAIWHCGQVVLLRRASGNPFNSKVSLLKGKVRKD